MSLLPLRYDEKAIDLPSGDQAGLVSGAGSVVRRLTFLPSRSMTYRSRLSFR